jgi:hypothetical protein
LEVLAQLAEFQRRVPEMAAQGINE